jgi:hypothetical protein
MIRFCLRVVKAGAACDGKLPRLSLILRRPTVRLRATTGNQAIAIAAPYPRPQNSVLRFAARVTQ